MRSRAGLGCGILDTFGSDVSPAAVQAAFDVSPPRNTCGAYVTGLSGVDTFRLEASDPGSVLAPGTDGLADAFLARFTGGRLSGCGPGGPAWSLRATTTATLTGTQVRARGCDPGAVAALFASGASPRAVSLTRCASGKPCETGTVLSLGAARDQAALISVDGDGQPDWHLSVGPLEVTEPGAPLARPALHFSATGTDDTLLLFDTAGPPILNNVRLSSCDALNVAVPARGLWLIKLDRSGAGTEALCRFAIHLGTP
jgi:hypothetical protein